MLSIISNIFKLQVLDFTGPNWITFTIINNYIWFADLVVSLLRLELLCKCCFVVFVVVGAEAWSVCGAHQSECGVSVSLHDHRGQQAGHQQGQGRI